jgi:energy-converting hydrogenase A subunit M
MSKRDQEPAKVSEFNEFLLKIGKLNYTWTNTESLLIHFIAGLAKCDKEVAVVIFLTLNTSRARLDLVERLAKLPGIPVEEREAVLSLSQEMSRLSSLRNRYNHCIYAFDPENGSTRTILMRIADRKSDIKMGQANPIDDVALSEIDETLAGLVKLNARFWQTAHQFHYPL